MPVVKCPICIEVVTGESVSDLSGNLELHLVEVHCWNPEELEESEGTEESREESVAPRSFSESILPAAAGERVSYGGSEKAVQGEAKSGMAEPTRMAGSRGPGGGLTVDEKEQSFEVGDTRTMSGMGGEWVQGKLVRDSASEESRGIRMEEESAVDCPMCKERVSGSDEENLSQNLSRHVMETHKDEPFITRMMEEMKNR